MIIGSALQSIVYRAVHPQFLETAGLDLGSTFAFGRFNRRNDRTLYTSFDPETAFNEYQQGEARPRPCVIVGLEVKLHNVIDFSAGYVPRTWKAHWKQALRQDWRVRVIQKAAKGKEWEGWLCGNEVRAAGVAGLIVPSTRNTAKGGRNLILFQDVRKVGEHWNDLDPFNDIPAAVKAIARP